jgi:hypothetical protein
VPILRSISPIIEDNHWSFKEAILFWLHLTSLELFLRGGDRGMFEYMCTSAYVMWIFKVFFFFLNK